MLACLRGTIDPEEEGCVERSCPSTLAQMGQSYSIYQSGSSIRGAATLRLPAGPVDSVGLVLVAEKLSRIRQKEARPLTIGRCDD